MYMYMCISKCTSVCTCIACTCICAVILFQASVKKVLNEMGRNDSDFFQELTQAFHQVRPSQTFCFCLGEVYHSTCMA